MTDAARARGSDEPGGFGFWLAVVLGGGLMLFGLKGLLDAAPSTRPAQVGLGFVGLDLLHDLVVAPLACLVGWLLTRALPRRWRVPVRAGLFATLVVLLVGWAPLRGYGRAQVPDNATVDPLDYGTALLTVLALVWVAVAAWIALRRHQAPEPARKPGRGDVTRVSSPI